MAANQPQKTLADYVAIAISPALIMAMVGSLVFFLIEVLYVGQYQARLQYILFFFVLGAVLIARISMTSEIADRAGPYGLVLGLLVWIALQTFVEYPPTNPLAPFGWLINLVLIALIWWSAHKLTWDCTLIDDAQDASGAGLLEMAGLEHESEASRGRQPPEETPKRPAPAALGLGGWWQRYRSYRQEQGKRPHAPGVWIVWFSLAALPLFGLGQILLSADRTRNASQAAAAQRYAFFLMTVYVGSGLGLLLTTSFLGLRRYLRQRRVHMPAKVTGAWLVIGSGLVLALLLLGALLPRPTAEYRNFLEWTGLVGSGDREASDWAQQRDGTGSDKGEGAGDKRPDKSKDSQGSGSDAKGKGQADDAKAGKGEKGDGGNGQGDKQKGTKGEKGKGGAGKAKGEQGQGRQGKENDKAADGRAGKPAGSPPRGLPQLDPQVANVLKWVVAIVAGLVGLYLLLRFLANFTQWARGLLNSLRAFWRWLSGWWRRDEKTLQQAEIEEPPPPRPFSAFGDPFLSGAADRMSIDDLLHYSFEALQAWAVEKGQPRQTGETPLEFAARLGEEFPAVEGEVRRLANFYAGRAYARRQLGPECREALRQFWLLLVEAAERPLSAGV